MASRSQQNAVETLAEVRRLGIGEREWRRRGKIGLQWQPHDRRIQVPDVSQMCHKPLLIPEGVGSCQVLGLRREALLFEWR